MSKYTIGSKVIKPDFEEHGVIIDVMPPRRGRQLYRVRWGSFETDELEANLLPDCDISDPFERCMNGLFGSYSDYAKKNTTFKIRNFNNSTISSLKASKTLFCAYQFKPLLKFLNSPNRRLLIADEVGLGKTIEAGHIMLEMKARRELHHVLIVCPKELRYKWKKELEIKFGLNFEIYESKNRNRKKSKNSYKRKPGKNSIKSRNSNKKIEELIDKMQNNNFPVRAIVNYDLTRNGKSDIVKFLSRNDFKFSLVLCDEAHKLRKSTTLRYEGMENILSHANAAVFLTATPVMISNADLYNLLHLLDNTRYYNLQIFNNHLQVNRPFVYALTDLNHRVSFSDIKKKLNDAKIAISFSSGQKNTTIGEAFADDILYKEIIKTLNKVDNTENRARLQYLISSMSMMNNIFSRTRKREATTDISQAERKPHLCRVTLTKEERANFDTVIEEYYIDDDSYNDDSDEEFFAPDKRLALVQKKRQVASSVYGYLNSEDNLDNGIDDYAEYIDAKFDELIRIINEVFKHETKKIVIFAHSLKTLKYLQIRLKNRGFGALMIHSDIKNRIDVLNEFKNDPEAHLLLSSLVGSEGLDMQFCNVMVNYDLPWNPMEIEQRIGRIDRFGQKSPIVNIYNIIVADSIQEEVYTYFLDRIGIFRGTIGDIEAILDAPLEQGGDGTIQEAYNKLEMELYTSRMTKEERQRKFAEIELAIINEKEKIEHLKEGLENSFINDAYFQEEINRIQNNNAYVTESELKNYLESAIRQKMSLCSLVKVEEEVYELRQPPSDLYIVHNFLTQLQNPEDENLAEFGDFQGKISGKQAVQLTFNQQTAYYDNKLEFINLYHPLIKACLNYFIKHDDESKTSFCYALKNDDFLVKGNAYYLIICQMNISCTISGVAKRTEKLFPLLYSINERKVVGDKEIVNRVFSRSQIDGLEHNASNSDIDSELIRNMHHDLAEKISELKAKQKAELRLQIDSDIQRSEKQIHEYYAYKIEEQRDRIRNWEAVVELSDEKRARELQFPIRNANRKIHDLEKGRENLLQQLRTPSQVELSVQILSLNLINII